MLFALAAILACVSMALLAMCCFKACEIVLQPMALAYYKLAAENGNSWAQERLGQAYLRGELGVKISLERSFHYYGLAAEQMNANALVAVGFFYYAGKIVKEAKDIAFSYFQQALQLKPEDHYLLGLAYRGLGLGYELGFSGQRLPERAFHYYQLAADCGTKEAWGDLFRCYKNGIGTEKCPIKAFGACTLAAKQGCVSGFFRLGYCYEEGVGVKQSLSTAFEWYKRAADSGQVEAQYLVASWYMKGKGVEQSSTNAHHYLELAAKQGHAKAKEVLNRSLEGNNGQA